MRSLFRRKLNSGTILSQEISEGNPSTELGGFVLAKTLPSSSFPLSCTAGQLNPLEYLFKPKSLKSFFFLMTNESRRVNTSNESTAERCKKKLPTTGGLMQAY